MFCDHLHVVVVGVTALHRLDGAVELGIVLVDEEVRALAAHEGERLPCGRLILARRPFVPVVDVQKLRIGLDRLVPPLLEIDPVALGVLDGLAQPGHVGGNRQVELVQWRFAVLPGPGFSDQARRDAGPA